MIDFSCSLHTTNYRNHAAIIALKLTPAGSLTLPSESSFAFDGVGPSILCTTNFIRAIACSCCRTRAYNSAKASSSCKYSPTAGQSRATSKASVAADMTHHVQFCKTVTFESITAGMDESRCRAQIAQIVADCCVGPGQSKLVSFDFFADEPKANGTNHTAE